MNLRILKKLSKRSAPLLAPIFGDTRQQFPAERGESYTGLLIMARKHWERGRSLYADRIWPKEIKRPARDGNGYVYAHPPSHPRKGTIMVGGVSGYYEPEWDEETAWEAFATFVRHHFTDWSGERPIPTRRIRTPREVFEAARDLARTALSEDGGGS